MFFLNSIINHINTDAVFVVSDVHPGVISEEVEFAHGVWNEYRDRIVGLIPRGHLWNVG